MSCSATPEPPGCSWIGARIRIRFWLAVLLLACPGPLSADILIKRQVTADRFATPRKVGSQGPECEVSVQKPESGDVVLIYLGPDRVRRDQRDLTIILREDRKRLFFLYPQVKKYSELKLPIKYERHTSGFAEMLGPELMRYSLERITGPEQATVGEWSVKRYSAVVVNKLRNNFHVTFAFSDAIEVEAEPLIRLETILHKLNFPGSSWIELLPARDGFPILWEQNVILPSSEVIYREEVTQLEEVDPEEDFYDIPKNFKKITYDRSCIELP